MSRKIDLDRSWPRETFRKSTRSDGSGNGNCVTVAVQGEEVAVGDTKTPVADSYAHFRMSTADLNSLLTVIKSGEIA